MFRRVTPVLVVTVVTVSSYAQERVWGNTGLNEPKLAYGRLSSYANIDYGTGRVRSMTVFGPETAVAVLREVLGPFKDLGVLGANSTRSRQSANSDHSSFSEAGLPGINMLQDQFSKDEMPPPRGARP